MKKLLLFIAAVVVLTVIVKLSDDDDKKPAPSPLDYSRPVFTNGFAIVCPLGVLFDVRADHGPEAVLDLFTSVLNVKSKEEKLGCVEWRGGLKVDAVRMSQPSDLHYVQVNGTFFTIEAHLTNKPSE
jgi:hypothetical protein